jgi:DNA-binding transcriptional LysR family regulator
MHDVSVIELRQLRQFIAVAEELHFRRAAARLGMAQPPLSQAMGKLEQELGIELFDRSRRQVRLTEGGLVLLEEARQTIAQAERAVEAARRASRGQTGLLRITYVGAALYDFLPRLVRSYRQRFPDVELQLRERTTTAQVRALQRGEADVGFVRPPVFGADDLHHETVLRDRVVAALPEDHRFAALPSIALAELADEAFVGFPPYEGPGFHARLTAACEAAGFRMRVVQEAVQMHAIIGLVASGLGVALVPASMRGLGQAGVVYRDLDQTEAPLDVDLAVLWRRGEPSSVVTAFLQALREFSGARRKGSSDLSGRLGNPGERN